MTFLRSKKTLFFSISLLFLIAIHLIEDFSSYKFFFLYIDSARATCIYTLLFIFFTAKYFFKKSHILIKLIIVLLSFILLSTTLFYYLLFFHYNYDIHYSPDLTHSYVTREFEYLIAKETRFLSRKGPFLLQYENSFETDNFYVEEIFWNKNEVTITVKESDYTDTFSFKTF